MRFYLDLIWALLWADCFITWKNCAFTVNKVDGLGRAKGPPSLSPFLFHFHTVSGQISQIISWLLSLGLAPLCKKTLTCLLGSASTWACNELDLFPGTRLELKRLWMYHVLLLKCMNYGIQVPLSNVVSNRSTNVICSDLRSSGGISQTLGYLFVRHDSNDISLVFGCTIPFEKFQKVAYPDMHSTKTFVGEQWKFHNVFALLR